MRAAIIATAAAVVVALWLFSPKPSVGVSSATLATLAPISDVRNRAHLEGLPVLHFEDLSFVFTESGDKPAPAARLVVDSGQRQ